MKCMKKLVTLMLTAGLFVCATAPQAQAVDVTASGLFHVWGDVHGNNRFIEGNTPWNVGQRIDINFNFAASENVSVTTRFRTETATWGDVDSGYAINASGWYGEKADFGIQAAYLDWKNIANSKTELRIGLQTIQNSSYTFGVNFSTSLSQPGVTLSGALGDSTGYSLSWFRPMADSMGNNTNFPSTDSGSALSKTLMDVFVLQLPMDYNFFKITPFAQFLIAGKDVPYSDLGADTAFTFITLFPSAGQLPTSLANVTGWTSDGTTSSATGTNFLDGQTMAWWLGFTSLLAFSETTYVTLDAMYGNQTSDATEVDATALISAYAAQNGTGSDRLNRQGWIVGVSARQGLGFANFNALAWYSSGDDDEADNGSERLPSYSSYVSPVGKLTGGMGHDLLFDPGRATNLDYQNAYGSPAGTFGAGASISDMSFLVQNLYHAIWVLYAEGTNDKAGINYTMGAIPGKYLTKKDKVLQVGLTNHYWIEKNFLARLDASYAFNYLDEDTWNNSYYGTEVVVGETTLKSAYSTKFKNPYKAEITLTYMF